VKITSEFLKNVYNRLLNTQWFEFSEGVEFMDGTEWIEMRRHKKKRYGEKFSVENLDSLTEEDYIEFLYFKNNYSWTQLYRTGLKAVEEFDKLKEAIKFLQDESISIDTRIREVVSIGGRYHVKGVGRNIATAILFVTDKEDKYGVWNSVTERALEKLGIMPLKSTDPGVTYRRINRVLNQLRDMLGEDLVAIDSLLWFLLHYT